MMIGTETHADIRHVVFSNSVIRDSNKVFGINVQDGATVSDVDLHECHHGLATGVTGTGGAVPRPSSLC